MVVESIVFGRVGREGEVEVEGGFEGEEGCFGGKI